MKSIVFFLSLFAISCVSESGDWSVMMASSENFNTEKANQFVKSTLPKKWYQGMAEVSTYTLTQNRYNDLHKGEVVQIFVTEDFLTDRQVKNDNYQSKHSTSVLKNNSVRKFTTGIYDYSMYTSVFTDVKSDKGAETLKITMSSQDWCGQSFAQINNRDNKYRLQSFSYFEKEGDQTSDLDQALLLDEVFNLIRINPELLPQGDIKVIPSLIYSRLKHKELSPVRASVSLDNYSGDLVSGNNLRSYLIQIPSYDARFEFIFSDEGTHEILAWTEKYPSAFDGQLRETVAVRKAVEWLPYWEKNGVEDEILRSKLLLL